ncbi:amidohydrolase family-domain-containing protein [Crassisporium funariophilum]|nr:amidohydrolase family-domain-containing protein [Crassisporium funariophilum]
MKPQLEKSPESARPSTGASTPTRRRWLGIGLLLGISALWSFNSKSYGPGSYLLCSSSQSIYTVDETSPRVECISVKGSRIVDTGNYDDIKPRPHFLLEYFQILPTCISEILKVEPRVIHVPPQSVVVPGLADAHAHIIENGYMAQLPLMGSKSVEEVIERIKVYILSHPDIQSDKERWIEGMGWDQTKWAGAQFPTAADLDNDPMLKGRLISLSRVDGHARWVSSAVLDLMHKLPEKVDGGLIVRDDQGIATGIFVDNAMNLIPIPVWTEKTISEFFDLTIKEALSYGLTSIHDADTKPHHIQFFQKMADAGKLPNRLYLMGNVASEEYWGGQIPRLVDYGKHRRLNLRSIKLFADGALGSWGAALLKPYSDKPDTRGLMLNSPENLEKLVRQFWKDGWQTNIHCIGDRANHAILDIYEDILTRSGGNVSEWRPRIEHAQIFAPEDLKRIGELGVIASVQPTHATSDMWYAQIRLGAERITGAYAYQTLLRASPINVLPLGSDFPIEGVNPLLGFYAVTTRLSVDGTSPHGPGGWFPDERLSRTQALKGMTLDAAYASFAENELGSLTRGKKADFVIFDRNIMTIPPNEILKAKVTATVVDGEVMYGSFD